MHLNDYKQLLSVGHGRAPGRTTVIVGAVPTRYDDRPTQVYTENPLDTIQTHGNKFKGFIKLRHCLISLTFKKQYYY